MAKAKRRAAADDSFLNQLNSQREGKEPDAPNPPERREDVAADGVRYVTIKVPVLEVKTASFRLHVDIDYQGEVASVARMISAGLTETGAKLNSGKPCYGANDAHRWLHEEIVRATS